MLVVTMTDGTRYATRTLPGDTGKPDAFAQGPAWTDAHIPRTEKPVRFCYLSNAPEVRPCVARGYMGYVQPVRFA